MVKPSPDKWKGQEVLRHIREDQLLLFNRGIHARPHDTTLGVLRENAAGRCALVSYVHGSVILWCEMPLKNEPIREFQIHVHAFCLHMPYIVDLLPPDCETTLKILEISSCFPPSRGGVERCVYELSTRFARDGNEVSVATSTRGKRGWLHSEIIDDMHVIRYPEKYHMFEAPLIPAVALTALTADYDVLHVHGMAPTITDLSILFAKMRGKPVVLTYHNDVESQQFGRLAKLAAFIYSSAVSVVIRWADVVVSSTYSYAHTSPALRFSLNKLQVIPMGIDVSKFQFDFSRDRNFEHTLLFVGQLKDYKGVAVLLDAIHYMRSQGHLVRADIVGTGPELGNLQTKARILNIEQCVRFLGDVTDQELLQLYATCDLFVLPSLNRREAFGIVLLEAMASGKTVVASDIPGVREIAMMGGFLAKPNDARSLAESIIHSIGNLHHPERVREVAHGFSWDKLAAKYESIFKSLIGK